MNDHSEVKLVPVSLAATVLLIDDRPNLQVFMMKRNANTRFAGGMWVFPGGAVDADDSAANYQKYCVHRSEHEANAELGIERGGLAYYVAAIREAFEEAGILLALNQESEEPLTLLADEDRIRFDQLRDGVNDGSVNFLEVIENENLILDAGPIHYVARWITPPGPPRRFDTRFFVTRMPDAQDPIHDDSELVGSDWLSPKDVIQKVADGEMGMLPPTLRMLERLAMFDCVADVIKAAASGLPDERVPMAGVNVGKEGPMTKAEPGWVRLRPIV